MNVSNYFLRYIKSLLFGLLTLFSFSVFADTDLIFVDQATNLCLDSNGSSVYTYQCNGGVFQIWTLQNDGVIRNRASSNQSKACLDSNASGNVYPYPCNGGDYQKWITKGSTLVNKATGLALDSNSSGSVYTMAPNAGAWQNWTRKSIGNAIYTGDTNFVFVSAATIGTSQEMCLDTNGTSFYSYACNEGIYQNWVLQNDGVIRSATVKKDNQPICVDSTSDGNVYPWVCNGADTQKWSVIDIAFQAPSNAKTNINRGVIFNNKVSKYSLVRRSDNSIISWFSNESDKSQIWVAKRIGAYSGCGNFQLKNSSGVCVSVGYSACGSNQHWDSYDGKGSCICNAGYILNGGSCSPIYALSSVNSLPGVAGSTPLVSPKSTDSLYPIYGSGENALPDNGDEIGVKLYKGKNYQDQLFVGSEEFKYIREGYYNLPEFLFNDAVASLKVTQGFRVTLFEDRDYLGKAWILDSNTSELADFSNKASSFRVYKMNTDGAKVTVYKNRKSGDSYNFDLGDYDSLGAMDQQITSLDIPSGWFVVLYDQIKFGGNYKIFTQSTDYVGLDWNDKARSMRVINNNKTGDWGDFQKACRNSRDGVSALEYTARIWNLKDPTNYTLACMDKGAWLEGEWRERPSNCEQDNTASTIVQVLSGVGAFIPFVPGAGVIGSLEKATVNAGLQSLQKVEKNMYVAGISGLASSSFTVGKDFTSQRGTAIRNGVWGKFLIRDATKCNALYSPHYYSCLGADLPHGADPQAGVAASQGQIVQKQCDVDSGKTQFVRVGETFQFVNNGEKSGLCLESTGYNESNPLELKPCNGKSEQNWRYTEAPGDGLSANYVNALTGLCLDNDGYNVYTHQCNGSENQKWK